MPHFTDDSPDPALPVKVGHGHLPKRMTINQAISWAEDQVAGQRRQKPTLEIRDQPSSGYRHIEVTFH